MEKYNITEKRIEKQRRKWKERERERKKRVRREKIGRGREEEREEGKVVDSGGKKRAITMKRKGEIRKKIENEKKRMEGERGKGRKNVCVKRNKSKGG